MNVPAHLLIVSTEPLALYVYRESLEVAGYQLSSAIDGEEALLWLHGSEPDLVLLDVALPESDSLNLLEAVRDSGFDVPIVVLTGEGKVREAVAAMKLGAVDVLEKPLVTAHLRSVVAEILARRSESMPNSSKDVVVTAQSEFAAKLDRSKRAFRRGAFDEAEVFLRQALALDTDSAEAHNLLGVLYEIRHQSRYACRHYRAALKADWRYGPARNNIRRIARRTFFGGGSEPFDTGGLRIEGGSDPFSLNDLHNRVNNSKVEG